MSEKHGSSITLTRRSFVAGAGVVAISCSLGSVGPLIPRAHADEAALDAAAPASADTAAAAATSQANAQNYFPDASTYHAFNLDTSVAPADFNDDTSSDPLAGFTTLDPQNLYVGYVNRTDYDKGSAYVGDSLEALAASSMKLDSMARKTLGSTTLDTNWKDYQYHANNACTLEHSGEQLIVSNTIYTGTYQSGHGNNRESGQDIQLQRFANGQVQTLARVRHGLTAKNDPLIMEHIQQEGSLGLLAMVGGDFDGDGNQELAVYNPYPAGPHIVIYRFDSSKNAFVNEQVIYLGDIHSSFGGEFSDWLMPIVHLATFSHGSYDDLVVTMSLPLTYHNSLGFRSTPSFMAIYSRKTGGSWSQLEQVYKYIPDFGDYRMRFASTLQTDLNGNGVPELIMAGHYNAYSKGDQVGWMVPEKNLVQMFTFDTVKEIYQYVWDVPQEVPALSDIFVQYEMCAPAALATGKFLRSEANDLLFLEGYVFSLSSTNKKGDSEAAHFRDGSFTSLYHMNLTGNRNHFITKAVSGNFAKTNIGTEQLIVQSGAVESSNYKVTFDVRWVLERSGKLATEDTDPSFIHNASTDDNGTFLTIAACDINKNNAFKFALKSKSFGWSAPQPLAILASVPYWSELSDERLGEEKTDIGTTTFGISSSESAGTEGRWGLGGGFNMSAELLLGAGILGNSAMLGGGFDFEAMLNYVGSYYHERNVERALTYEEYAGRTMVVTSAVPVVVYEYDVYVPEFTVTQDYLDEYNKHAAPGTQWGPEKVGTKAGNVHVAYKVDNTYDATLGLMTLEDYNNAAANVGSKDVPTIDMAAVFPHTQGDPTTYPTQTSQITNVHNNGNALLAGPNVQVAADKGSATSAEITVTDTSQFTNGFDITVGGYVLGRASPGDGRHRPVRERTCGMEGRGDGRRQLGVLADEGRAVLHVAALAAPPFLLDEQRQRIRLRRAPGRVADRCRGEKPARHRLRGGGNRVGRRAEEPSALPHGLQRERTQHHLGLEQQHHPSRRSLRRGAAHEQHPVDGARRQRAGRRRGQVLDRRRPRRGRHPAGAVPVLRRPGPEQPERLQPGDRRHHDRRRRPRHRRAAEKRDRVRRDRRHVFRARALPARRDPELPVVLPRHRLHHRHRQG